MERPSKPDSASIADCQSNLDGEKPQRQPSNPDELSSQSVERHEVSHEEYQYVTGFKLAVVIVSVTLVVFLVMLDLSIVATVSHAPVC